MRNKSGKGKTRRQFIRQSALAVGGIHLLYGCAQTSGSSASLIDKNSLEKFRKNFRGTIILPGDNGYETIRRTRSVNPEMDRHPAIIASCQVEQDVVVAVDFARVNNLEIAVRSGNHSNMGWGTCDDGIVIDLSKMKGATVNPDRTTALVAVGSSAEEILSATAPFGIAPVLGQCGSVGAGLALGGGLGWLSGKYGATCDHLLAARIVTADAQALALSPTENPDLFWGIRGGGGNFGVVTQLEYRLHPITQMLAGRLTYSPSESRRLFLFFREFMSQAPDELQGDCYITREACWVEFVYTGEFATGESLLDQFRKFAKPVEDTIRRAPFSEVYQMEASRVSKPLPYRVTKGTYIERMTQEVIDVTLDQIGKAPQSCHLRFNFSHFMHGEVCRTSPQSTAFSLRQPFAAHLVFWAAWSDPIQANECMLWHKETFQMLQSYSGGHIYANYMSVPGGSTAKAVYGENLPRLAQLKKKHDSNNIFHLNQNILTS